MRIRPKQLTLKQINGRPLPPETVAEMQKRAFVASVEALRARLKD